MKSFVLLIALFFACSLKAQTLIQSADTIKPPAVYENVYSRSLYSDTSNVSSFIIFIKKEVKAHKHLEHAEHVIVLDGKAEMTLNDKTFLIKKGDVIFIPKNSFHSVKNKSKIPLKVLSIQTPYFDGKDRVYKE